jgi:serine/threonine-protein kinase
MSANDKLAPGTVLGRYELLLPIAQGGMATVWAARQKGSRGFQKTVAVKTMLPALSDDPQFEQMFLDEASLAARIHHPNVAEILDLGEQDDVLYIVMEWVDGEALSIIAKTAKKNEIATPLRIALRIVRQACAGLHAAHELRNEHDQPLDLVHRDVSPQNVLVTYDGIVKLVDFGVAKAIGRAAAETSAGQLKGKIPYMSPEQARGGKVDRRTDIFAMGIVLYRLTTGLHPFLGPDDITTMRNIITRPVLPPRMKNPQFSAELEQILMQSLQKDADKRFQTMLDFDAALERVLAASGSSVVDDDIGAWVRSVMGDRGPKRRAALRDAIRVADERAAGIALTPQNSPSATVHEGVSDILITKMTSAVTPGPSGADAATVRASSMLPAQPAAPAAPAEPDYTLGAEPPRKRLGLIVAAAAAAIAMGGALIVMKSIQSDKTSPAEPAGASNKAAAAHSSSPIPPPLPASSAATVPATAATAGGPAVPVAAVDISPAADTPSAASDSSDADDAAPSRRRAGGGRAKPTAPASASAPPTSPRTTSKPWVPPVQDPGF